MRTDPPPLSTFPAVGLPAAIWLGERLRISRESAAFHLNVDGHFRLVEFSISDFSFYSIRDFKNAKPGTQNAHNLKSPVSSL